MASKRRPPRGYYMDEDDVMPYRENGVGRAYDPEARMAALDERVTNVSVRLTAIETSMQRMSTELSGEIRSISTAFNTSRSTDWKGLAGWGSLLLGVMTVLGGIGYTVMSNSVSALDLRLTQAVSTINQRQASTDDYLKQNIVSRAEHDRKDTQLRDVIEKLEKRSEKNTDTKLDKDLYNAAHLALQGDVNNLRTAFGGTYSLKDALADMQRRLDRLEFHKPGASGG